MDGKWIEDWRLFLKMLVTQHFNGCIKWLLWWSSPFITLLWLSVIALHNITTKNDRESKRKTAVHFPIKHWRLKLAPVVSQTLEALPSKGFSKNADKTIAWNVGLFNQAQSILSYETLQGLITQAQWINIFKEKHLFFFLMENSFSSAKLLLLMSILIRLKYVTFILCIY